MYRWKDPSVVTDWKLFRAVVLTECVWILYPLVFSIYTAASGNNDPALCFEVYNGQSIALGIPCTVGGVILAIALRNVHDAYFLKVNLLILVTF